MLWTILIIVLCLLGLGFILRFWLVVLLTVCGWYLYGPMGAGLGFIIGGLIQASTAKRYQAIQDQQANGSDAFQQHYQQQSTQQSSYQISIEQITPIVRLVCCYAIYPSQMWTSEKVSFVKKTFEDYCKNQQDIEHLKLLLKEKNTNIDECIRQFLMLRPDYTSRLGIFDICSQALNFNDINDRHMEQVLSYLGQQLGLRSFDYQSIIDRYKTTRTNQNQQDGYSYNYRSNNQREQTRQNSSSHLIDQAYKLLDVSRTATKDEVVKAYRKKMMLYHPDKNPNVTPEVQDMLNEKSREIQNAKDLLVEHLSR